MHIQLLGINYHTAPVEIREKLSLSKQELKPALIALKQQVGEGIILSTCNRTETYTVSESKDSPNKAAKAFWSNYLGVDLKPLEPYLYSYSDLDAARHLSRVAAGLDSQILGEFQVLGQVREAFTSAAKCETVETLLSQIFHCAITVGRRVRNETSISKGSLSISYSGVQLAKQLLGDLSGLKTLLVGVGETGELVAKALRSLGAGELTVINRTDSRAEALASELNAKAAPFENLHQILKHTNLVISSVEAPNYLITKPMLQQHANGTRVLIDLSIPRSIDPQVAEVANVHLYNLDDLAALAQEHKEARKAAIAEAEKIIEEEMTRLQNWWESLKATPAIKAIRQQADDIRQRELEKAIKLLPSLTAEEIKTLDKLTRSIVDKVLYNPIQTLKCNQSTYYIGAAQELFHLNGSEPQGHESK